MGHLIALQLYDLPEGQRNAALKKLNLGEISKDVEKTINDFNLLSRGVDKSQINRLRSFLQQTSTGQYLLAQWDSDLNALDGYDRRLMEFFQKGGVFDSVPDVTYKSLQTMAMLVDMLNKLQRAQSDADMAIEVGKTVAQYTTAGMIVGYAQLGLQGDLESIAWALALYICPKLAIPSLVKSIGVSVGDMAASTVFEAQFQHLYEHAKFNEQGRLIQVLDYGGANPACAFVNDIREPGAFRLLTDKLTFAGANALLSAIEGTIYGGTPLVMTDNASLQGACAEVKRINALIEDVHKVESATPQITRDAGPGEDVSYLSRGGQQAVKELLRLRSDAQKRILSILCESIKADLESRHAAEQALGAGGQEEIDELYAKIQELFRQLDMYDEGIGQLRKDAGMDAKVVDWLRSTSRKERNIKIMQTLQRYHDAYSQVLRLRTAAETLLGQYAGDAPPSLRILTGFIPLTADPDYDPSLAAKILQELTEALQHDLDTLLSIKKEALCDGSILLDSDFDRSTSRKVYLESLGLLQTRQIQDSAIHVTQRESWYWSPLYKAGLEKQKFHAYGAADARREARKAALEEFTAHYAAKGPSMDIVPPAEVAAGRGEANRPYLFTLALEHVPDHAEFTWFEDAKPLGSGPVLEHAFGTEGTRVMRARASWKKRPGNWCDGDLTSEFGVDIPSSPGASSELNIILPAPLGSGPGRAGEPYTFGVATVNIPQDAEYVWRVDMEQAGEGQSLRKQFDRPGRYMLAVHAQWRVKGTAGVMDQASGRAMFSIEEAGEPDTPDGPPSQADPDAPDEHDPTGDPGQQPAAPAQPDDYRRPWGDQDDPGRDQPRTPGGPPADPGTTAPGEVPGPVSPQPGTTGPPVDVPTVPDGPGGPGASGFPPGDTPESPPPGQEKDPEPPQPPVCTYEYSVWGPCDRDTKKQTRTVIGTSPTGCVESGQPSLEQGCTPPPTEEEMFGRFMYCLCFHSPHGWAGHIGVGYSPSGYDECHNSGPCIGGLGAWGNCRRHFISTTEEQKKSCYEGAYGKDSWDPEKANALIKAENDKAKLPLELKLSIEECPVTVQLGEIVTFTATPNGGIPPYTYSWSGNGQAEEKKFTFANSREPGTHPVSVTVSDSDGSSATVECPIIVDAVTVTIEKTSPPENELPVGAKASFRATVTSAGKPVGGELLYRWEPHPEVRFGDEANPQHETTSPTTTATYLRPGNVGMWVNVLQKEGETYRTIGESDQLPMSIIGPTLTLAADKSQPKVGETVVVTVKEEPAMTDDAIGFVWEVRGDVLSAGAAPNVPNHRAHSFVFKDAQPVTVTVRARTKFHGDDLGEASIELSAQGYEVTISGPEYRGPKPRIWKCDGQLGTAKDCRIVEVDQELAVFRDLGLAAKVTPEPEKGPVKYRWSIDPSGICGIPGSGRELTINCSQTGTYLVRLEARDSQDVILGQAEKSVAITISQEDLDNAERLKVSLEAGDPVRVGESVTIQAEVAGGKAPLTFTWSGGVDGSDTLVTFTPTEPGVQTITVQAADADGKRGEAEIKLDAQPAALAVELACDPSTLKVGEMATLTATVSGGMPEYNYAWIGASGSGESFKWTPEEPGEQEVSVQVTDKKGETISASLKVEVLPLPLQAELSVDKAEVKLGDAVSVQAKVSGGKPEYSYAWTGVTGQGAAATWNAGASGRHMVSVQVTDKDGQTAGAEVELTVTAPPLKVTLAVDQKDVRVGESVQFTATVTGGEPDFGFAWGGGPQGQGSAASWAPEEPGDHDVTVEVRDKGGQTASAAASITVKPPKLEVILTADKEEIAKGDWITLTAEVTGGQPEYTATWGKDISGNGLEGTWYAHSAGKQTLSVTVRDKSRQTEKASITFKVKDADPVIVDDPGPLSVELTADQNRIGVGQTATLRAATSGGTGPYTYSWSQAVRDNGDTGLFTPTETGYYQLFVEVRDAGQARQTARIDIHVEQGAADAPDPAAPVVGGPLSVRLVPERTTMAQAESMTIQAQASGGRAPYAYSWSRTVHGAGETVVFTPTNTGFYQIFVEVRDADHQKVTAQVDVQVQQSQQGQAQSLAQSPPQTHVATAPSSTTPPAAEQSGNQPAQPAQSPPTTGMPYSIAGDTRVRTTPNNIDYEDVGKMISGLNQGLGTRSQEIEAATSTNSTAAAIPESYGKVGFGAKPKDKDDKKKDKKHGKPDHGSHQQGGPHGTSPGTSTGASPGGLQDVVVNSRTITLSIWDHGKEDNDIVTIKVNGTPIPGGSNVVLTKQPKTFQLQLNTGRNEISIYAVNEGTQPPNTASFRLSNVTQGEQEQKYRINQNESAAFGATVVIQ
ncbi:PKD domain-containing protein [Desulfonatronum sp. SC1]|uniref:PKD domain-containing protein n=1 Tax=Desulfonatronum sp. SC1 TaxID=2109626 RepID=UPI0011B1D27F|nr:PKD domain-containing protein [Desulfonatronum sp. SC1]